MRSALELAFASAPAPELLRQIVFITDGSVGNEEELVRLIHARIGARAAVHGGYRRRPQCLLHARGRRRRARQLHLHRQIARRCRSA